MKVQKCDLAAIKMAGLVSSALVRVPIYLHRGERGWCMLVLNAPAPATQLRSDAAGSCWAICALAAWKDVHGRAKSGGFIVRTVTLNC